MVLRRLLLVAAIALAACALVRPARAVRADGPGDGAVAARASSPPPARGPSARRGPAHAAASEVRGPVSAAGELLYLGGGQGSLQVALPRGVAELAALPAPVAASPALAAAEAPAAPDARYAFAGAFGPQCSVILEQVPALGQERNLSCEAAAVRMVLAGWGVAASEREILGRMGHDPDPRRGFRGSVDGAPGRPDLRDYGVHAEVVGAVLAGYGAPAEVVHGLADEELARAVSAGRAAIVWMSGYRKPVTLEEDGCRLVQGEHVLVVVGIGRDGRFLVHDPWGARPHSGRPGTYLLAHIPNWDLFERAAVLVAIE